MSRHTKSFCLRRLTKEIIRNILMSTCIARIYAFRLPLNSVQEVRDMIRADRTTLASIYRFRILSFHEHPESWIGDPNLRCVELQRLRPQMPKGFGQHIVHRNSIETASIPYGDGT